jgi:tetratricopeptide (TPR) repeat protein
MRHVSIKLAVAAVLAAGVVMSGPAGSVWAASVSQQVENLEIEALNAQDKGDLNTAIEKFRQAYALKPSDKALRQNFADALNSAGVNLFDAKDYAGAKAKFTEALTILPNFARAKENLGKAESAKITVEGSDLYKLGDIEGAKAKFAAAAAADPNNISAKTNLATSEADLLVKSGDLAGVAAKRHEALALVPDNANLKQKADEADAALAEAQAKAATEKAEKDKEQK